MTNRSEYPFTAIAGQENMKRALVLNAVNPALGGVLIRGEKGTAKSTAVRALANLLPEVRRVRGCPFGCSPDSPADMCALCRAKSAAGEELEAETAPMRVVDLPVSATEDRVVGTLNIEHALKTGEKEFEPGILAYANGNILYVDEVNLLDDHVVDVLLDSAAMGVNTVEREGVSYTHPARFVLVGTMNPEEGELRPQLTDRFGLSVEVSGEREVEVRMEILENRLRYESGPEQFVRSYAQAEADLRDKIVRAKKNLGNTRYSRDILRLIAKICIELEVDGHRADITILKTAITMAAFDGREDVSREDVTEAAKFALPHRMRRRPFEEREFDPSVMGGL